MRSTIEQSPYDSEFRKVVSGYIRKAEKNIKIVTGEISAYSYFDLRKAAEEAAEKGVDIKVYANGPDESISSRLIRQIMDVYIGK
jgi:hypothetical protein